MKIGKTCKKCNSLFNQEEHKIENYNIIILKCKCNWKLVDVIDNDGNSLKEILDRKIIEKMLRSKFSNIKL